MQGAEGEPGLHGAAGVGRGLPVQAYGTVGTGRGEEHGHALGHKHMLQQ